LRLSFPVPRVGTGCYGKNAQPHFYHGNRGAASVATEAWTEQADGRARIEQVIYVQRATQKAIVLGKKGPRIKSIGADARVELEELLDRRVHLFLFVKVREKWGDDPDRYRDWGLD
jgi:GTP-binding protein Era